MKKHLQLCFVLITLSKNDIQLPTTKLDNTLVSNKRGAGKGTNRVADEVKLKECVFREK